MLLLALGTLILAVLFITAAHQSRLMSRVDAHLVDVHTAILEQHRLTSRLIELEAEKQQTRASGRNLLRERLQERLTQAAATRAATGKG